MADTQVTFDIVTRGADRSARDFRRLGGAVEDTGRRFERLNRFAKRTAVVAGAALGGAVVVAARGMYDAAKAAAEEEQEMKVLRNTLRKTTKATDAQVASAEDWITALQNATGVADGDLRPALGKLLIATKDQNKAQDLLKVGLDVSTARGKSLNTVVEALAKAAQGSTEGLRRLGVQTKDASGKALTFDQVLQNMNDTMGGAAAAAADTTAGRFEILKRRFEDLKEAIGARLLPYLNRFGQWLLDKGIPAISKFAGWVRDDLWPALKKFGSGVGKGILGFFSEFGKQVGLGGDGAENMKSGLKGFGDLLTKKVLPALGTLVEKVGPKYGEMLGRWIGLLADVGSAFVGMSIIGLEAFGALAAAALDSFGTVLHGLQLVARGIPGLSGKVDKAAERFDAFREKTQTSLDRTKSSLLNLKAALDSIRPKTITVGVNYVTSGKFAGKPLPIDGERAHGGPVRAGGTYLVGENGPEVITPSRSGYVHPNGGGLNIEHLEVHAAPGERAERSVPRALTSLMYRVGTA